MEQCKMVECARKNNILHQWQTKKANLVERNSFMYCNELISDIKFNVGKIQQNQIIPAHKYVLGTSSPVFFAMCYGEFTNDDMIIINDCEPEPFLELLRFIYCDQVNLTPANVLDVLFLADKYIVPCLTKECISFLSEHVNIDNVLDVLGAAVCLNEKGLEKHCWSIMSRRTSEIFLSESFLHIDLTLLKSILKKDCLNVLEIEVFEGVQKWAIKECSRKNLPPTSENQKFVLSDAITLIRFPVMTPKEFALVPAQSNLLPLEDVKNIFIYLNSGGSAHVLKYPSYPRSFKPYMCKRYVKPMKNYLWRYDEKDIDAIRFQVDQEIFLSGVGLFGSPCGGEYSVEVTILKVADDDIIYKNKTTFICPPDPEFNNINNPQIHEIKFDELIAIKEHVFYDIFVLLDGPPSFAGDDGKQEVNVEGVKFVFDNSSGSTNGTSFDEGQIPTLLFYF